MVALKSSVPKIDCLMVTVVDHGGRGVKGKLRWSFPMGFLFRVSRTVILRRSPALGGATTNPARMPDAAANGHCGSEAADPSRAPRGVRRTQDDSTCLP